MSGCSACGCPEVECLDMHTLALAAGEWDECCADCTHRATPDDCPYCHTGCEWWARVLDAAKNDTRADASDTPHALVATDGKGN